MRATVQRLTLKPGDRLAIQVDRPLTSQMAQRIRAIVEQEYPGVPVLILDEGMSLKVVEGP